jgi:hypothetical protein
MYIAVVHDITDPEKFWDVSRTAVEQGGIPEGFTLHGSYPNTDGTRAVCLWETGSVETMKGFLEQAVGAFSKNEYFEVAPDKAMGLPA